MKTLDELNPCPFCGQRGEIIEMQNRQYYPVCAGESPVFCLLRRQPDLENDGFALREHAVEVWNKRKP